MRRKIGMLCLFVFIGSLTSGCGLLAQFLAEQLGLLGVRPANDFETSQRVNFMLLPTDKQGNVVNGALRELDIDVEVTNPPGVEADRDRDSEKSVPGKEFTSLAILMDSSGSMADNDPDRQRVEAVIGLVRRLLEAAPDSHIAIYDFGPYPDQGMKGLHRLSGFSNDADSLTAAAEDVVEEGSTPLYDALLDAIGLTADDSESLHGELLNRGRVPEGSTADESIGKLILVLSDGDDTASWSSIDEVVTEAAQKGVVIHAIGLGGAALNDDVDDPLLSVDTITTVQHLQTIATNTDGFYASVNDPQNLVQLYESIALSLSQGYEVATYRLSDRPQAGEAVKGNLRVGTMGNFRIPWSFVSP